MWPSSPGSPKLPPDQLSTQTPVISVMPRLRQASTKRGSAFTTRSTSSSCSTWKAECEVGMMDARDDLALLASRDDDHPDAGPVLVRDVDPRLARRGVLPARCSRHACGCRLAQVEVAEQRAGPEVGIGLDRSRPRRGSRRAQRRHAPAGSAAAAAPSARRRYVRMRASELRRLMACRLRTDQRLIAGRDGSQPLG